MFAVLLERVRWSVAFKTVVFMPMAISLFAAGVIWRVMDEKDPDVGAVNAAIKVVADEVDPPGALSQAQPSSQDLKGSPSQGLTLQTAGRAGRQREARPHGDSAGRRARGRRAGARAAGAPPARSPASCGATSSPAAASPA